MWAEAPLLKNTVGEQLNYGHFKVRLCHFDSRNNIPAKFYAHINVDAIALFGMTAAYGG